jgi:hypothetical protein
MRGSDRTPLTLDLYEDISKYNGLQTCYTSDLISLCDDLGGHMSLFDDINVETKSENKSLLFVMISFINNSDGDYVKTQINARRTEFDAKISEIVTERHVTIIDGVIISSAGTPKKPVLTEGRIRRVSFVSTNYGDNNRPLRIIDVTEMKDLAFLFSLNGYRLPYTASHSQRSMYERFFHAFISKFIDQEGIPQDHEAYRFYVLKEAIYNLHTMCELYVDILECIFEMASVVHSRIKTASCSIDKRIVLEQFSCPIFEHLFGCLNSDDKAFSTFKKRKLTSSISNEEERQVKEEKRTLLKSSNGRYASTLTWLQKVEAYASVLGDTVEMYNLTSERCRQNVSNLRKTQETQIEEFCNNIISFILSFDKLLGDIFRANSLFQRFLESGKALLTFLDDLEKRYPMKYGSTSPRNKTSPRALTRQGSAQSLGEFLKSSVGSILSPRK